MNINIGVITTFYGYEGRVVSKVERLINIFRSLDLQPFIQLHSEPNGSFKVITSDLTKLKKEFDIEYSIHQSMWLPNKDFILNLGSSNTEIWTETVKSIKKSIDLARALNARNVSFHGGYAAQVLHQKKPFDPLTTNKEFEITYEEAYANVKRGFEKLLDYSKGNVQLSVENLNYRPDRRYLFSSPKDFEYLTEGINVLFDIGHAYYSQNIVKDNMYIKQLIKKTRGIIAEIHVSDNSGLEDEHKLFGQGSIHFAEIFKLITNKSQKMPPLIIEAVKSKHNYSDEDLKNSIINLRNTLLEIKT